MRNILNQVIRAHYQLFHVLMRNKPKMDEHIHKQPRVTITQNYTTL